MGYYELTSKAFEAVIKAEVDGEMLVDAAHRLHDEIERVRDRVPLYYTAPPEPRDDDDLRARIEERRKTVNPLLRRVQEMADHYFAMESKLRGSLLDANRIVDAAAVELDSPATPPLQRTAIAIRRALGQVSASVPYPMTAGWAEGAEPKAQERMRKALFDVIVWIQELRLLVQPQHTMPPPLGAPSILASQAQNSVPLLPPPAGDLWVSKPGVTSGSGLRSSRKRKRRASTRQKAAPPSPARIGQGKSTKINAAHRSALAKSADLTRLTEALTTNQIRILLFLKRRSATSRDDRTPKSYIASQEFGTRFAPKNLTRQCDELRALGLLDATPGRNGGYWLSRNGQVVCHYLDQASSTTVLSAPIPPRDGESINDKGNGHST